MNNKRNTQRGITAVLPVAEQLLQPQLSSSAVDSRKNGWNYSALESFLNVSKQIIIHWLNIFSSLFLKLDYGPYGETR